MILGVFIKFFGLKIVITNILPIFTNILSIFYRYFFRNFSTCKREIKSRNFAEISGISDISAIFLRFFSQPIIGWQFRFGARQ